MAYWFVMCDLKFHFSKQYKVCHKSFTSISYCYIFSTQLPSYSVLCVLLLSLAISPQIQHLPPIAIFGQINLGLMDLF